MVKRKRFTFWFAPVLYITGVIMILSVIFSIQSFTEHGDEDSATMERTPPLNQSFSIPDRLDFAGEGVPLQNYDVRESLDRELLVNGYFHSRTIYLLKKSKRYFAVIEPVLRKYHIPDDFKYLAMAESDLENVVSPARAVGVWQLLEGTAREYELEVNSYVDERYDLEKSTEAACKYILDSYEKYGSWTLAAASYNMGRNNLDSQIERQKTGNYYDLLLNDETARYIYRVLAQKLVTENPEAFGFIIEDEEYYPVIKTYTVTVDNAVDNLADFAVRYSINYKILKQMNPWLRQNALPNNSRKTYSIEIPESGQRSFTRQ
ncbi:MAG: lytic transglycosylase domain-containing protein [Bacteroidales bacterium]|nr:lytic transglycosylase domain-containing protein [Bacteroidales bacterium]